MHVYMLPYVRLSRSLAFLGEEGRPEQRHHAYMSSRGCQGVGPGVVCRCGNAVRCCSSSLCILFLMLRARVATVCSVHGGGGGGRKGHMHCPGFTWRMGLPQHGELCARCMWSTPPPQMICHMKRVSSPCTYACRMHAGSCRCNRTACTFCA